MSDNRKKIVIIGATSAIAGRCVRLWALEQPADIFLVGREISRMERVAADIKAYSPESELHIRQAQFLEPAAIQATVEDMVAESGVDIALIAQGALPEQNQCQDTLCLCREALEINGISPVLYAEAFARHFAKANHGTLVLIGSVAGDRGRKSNYIYGAAKNLVARYAEGLQHRFAGTGVRIVLVKPGPTDTPMTAHLKGQGVKLASVDVVAQQIVKGVAAGKTTLYTPGKWRWIMGVIRHLPEIVFNRMNI